MRAREEDEEEEKAKTKTKTKKGPTSKPIAEALRAITPKAFFLTSNPNPKNSPVNAAKQAGFHSKGVYSGSTAGGNKNKNEKLGGDGDFDGVGERQWGFGGNFCGGGFAHLVGEQLPPGGVAALVGFSE